MASARFGKDSTSVMQSPWEHGGPIQPTTFGAILRDARLGLGRSLQDAERQTRILARHLSALESGDFHLLPTGIYARGFVYNYANWLQLNPQEMVRLFNEARGEPEAVFRPQSVGRQVNTSGPFSPNFVVIVFVIGILSVVAAWGYSLLVQTPPKKPIIDVPTVAATPTAITGASALISTAAITPTAGTGTSTIRIPETSGTATGTATGTNAAATGTVSATPGTSSPATGTAATVSAAPATSLKVTITSTVKSWVEIYADGDKNAKTVGYINPGETREIEARQTVTIYCGKPDNVTYSVNGVDKGNLPKEALQTQGFTISL
jgi:cytoskeleton protein RodZ